MIIVIPTLLLGVMSMYGMLHLLQKPILKKSSKNISQA